MAASRAGPCVGAGSGIAAAELRRLFLELAPEESRQFRVSEFLQRLSESDAAECIAVVFDRLVNFSTDHVLGVHALSLLLRLHPAVMARCFMPQHVYDLFCPKVDDASAAAFLSDLLSYKESCGSRVEAEGAKLQRLLLRRSKKQDLRQVPASPLRAWLCHIWRLAPSSRPPRQLMAECCAHWIGDSAAQLADKVPCLALMRQEAELRGHPGGESWALRALLEQVCRDPVGHSPDLQHLLWPLGSALSPSTVAPLLRGLSHEPGRLATLWLCLCLWPPQPQLPDDDTAPWPPTAPPPVHLLLCAMFAAFSQLAVAARLCLTSLLTLAAVALSGEGSVACAAAELMLLLHRSGPASAADIWMPLVPVLEHPLSRRFASSAELLSRLRQTHGGPGTKLTWNAAV